MKPEGGAAHANMPREIGSARPGSQLATPNLRATAPAKPSRDRVEWLRHTSAPQHLTEQGLIAKH